MPLRHEPSSLTITADARLDNRGTLLPLLAPDRPGIGDGELILLAFLKWGQDCLANLLGDFAFAIWDERNRTLFAARDPIGMRQLCYAYRPGKFLVFATDPEAVIEHFAVDRTVSLRRVAQFLDGLESADLRATFFEGVHRLEAAHTLSLTERGFVSRRYWSAEMPPPLRLKSDGDYAEALYEELRGAVAPRLRSYTPVGATLSGGMDSTAICAVAAGMLGETGRGRLKTFSVVGPDPSSCVETRSIHAALAIANIDPTLIRMDDPGDILEQLVEQGRDVADPFDTLMTVPRAVYANARSSGINVVFDGVGGDMTLSLPSHVARLLKRWRIAEAWREAVGENRYWGPSWQPWRAFGRGLLQAYAPPLWTMRQAVREWAHDRKMKSDGRITADLASATGLNECRRVVRTRDRNILNVDAEELLRQVSNPSLIVGRERYDRVAAAFGVEPRDAFLDLRFIRFCLSLPTEQLQCEGYPKPILRRAMAGRVPDAVRWRRGKEHLGQQMNRNLMANVWQDKEAKELESFLDANKASRADLRLGPVERHNLRIERLSLNHWLKRHR